MTFKNHPLFWFSLKRAFSAGTTVYDKRVMTFVDNLWGFEVTGGADQFEPLTVVSVRRCGLARRAGIRVNDKISKINEIDAMKLTLAEAQALIQESGREVKIYVWGDEDTESDDELTADCWFKPRKLFGKYVLLLCKPFFHSV